MHHLAQVQDAGDVAELAAVGGKSRVVRGGELREDVFSGGLQIDRLDLRPGRHHVLDGDRFEVEQVDEDALVLLRHELPGLEHEEAQLLHRQALRSGVDRDAQQPQQAADEEVHDPEHPGRCLDERLEHVARRKGGLLRIAGADHLRRDLGEHEDQQSHYDGGDSENDPFVAEQVDCHDADDHRDRRIHQRVAGEQHRKQPVGPAQELGGEPRAAVAGALERAQAIAVDRHHAGLRHGEKSGEDQQESERDELYC